MAIQRIVIRDDGGGNEYELPVNPTELDMGMREAYRVVPTLDGPPVRQRPRVDASERRMVWRGWPHSGSAMASSVQEMVDTLKSFVGKPKEIRLYDADYGAFYDRFGWIKIMIDQVDVRPRSGGPIRKDITVKFHLRAEYDL